MVESTVNALANLASSLVVGLVKNWRRLVCGTVSPRVRTFRLSAKHVRHIARDVNNVVYPCWQLFDFDEVCPGCESCANARAACLYSLVEAYRYVSAELQRQARRVAVVDGGVRSSEARLLAAAYLADRSSLDGIRRVVVTSDQKSTFQRHIEGLGYPTADRWFDGVRNHPLVAFVASCAELDSIRVMSPAAVAVLAHSAPLRTFRNLTAFDAWTSVLKGDPLISTSAVVRMIAAMPLLETLRLAGLDGSGGDSLAQTPRPFRLRKLLLGWGPPFDPRLLTWLIPSSSNQAPPALILDGSSIGWSESPDWLEWRPLLEPVADRIQSLAVRGLDNDALDSLCGWSDMEPLPWTSLRTLTWRLTTLWSLDRHGRDVDRATHIGWYSPQLDADEPTSARRYRVRLPRHLSHPHFANLVRFIAEGAVPYDPEYCPDVIPFEEVDLVHMPSLSVPRASEGTAGVAVEVTLALVQYPDIEDSLPTVEVVDRAGAEVARA